MHGCMLSHFSHIQFFGTILTLGHQDPLSMGFSRQKKLERVAMPFCRGSSRPRDGTHISCRFYTWSHLGSWKKHPGPHHLHTRQKASLSVATTRKLELQRLIGENDWHSEYQYLSQVNSLQQHEEPRNEQHEGTQQNASHDGEYLCNTEDLEFLEER